MHISSPVPSPEPSPPPRGVAPLKLETETAQNTNIDTRTTALFERMKSEEGLPMICAIEKEGSLPPFFRTSGILPIPSSKESPINLSGLRDLHISGSAQFSECSMSTAFKRIRALEGKDTHIIDIDLKQEDGLFAFSQKGEGAIAFTFLKPLAWWMGPTRPPAEILRSEEARARALTGISRYSVYGVEDSVLPGSTSKDHHKIVSELRIAPEKFLTEEQFIRGQKNCSYVRIADKKFGNMEWHHVDQLIELVRENPRAHLYFHCRKGLSRTTMFMVMVDMLKNARAVSADDIIRRHGSAGLGGVDLLKLPPKESWDYKIKSSWITFLRQFHEYAKSNAESNFHTSWSQWAHDQGIPNPEEIELDPSSRPSIEVCLPKEEEVDRRKERPLVLNVLEESKVLAQNFRTTQGIFPGLETNPRFNPTGLHDMKMSASGQYSRSGFKKLVERIKSCDPQADIHIFDLQHYPHLFINGHEASLLETPEEFIQELSAEEIKQKERALKEEISHLPGVKLRTIDTKYPQAGYDKRFSLRVRPESVETPEELITKEGAHYILVPARRFADTSDDQETDRLVQYVQNLKPHTWTHFHCKMGKSRTTLYATMFDMLHNADKAPLHDIVRRQQLIGGVDLFDVSAKDTAWALEAQGKRDRVVFLARFHTYARDEFLPKRRAGEVPMSWSAWSKLHADYRPEVEAIMGQK